MLQVPAFVLCWEVEVLKKKDGKKSVSYVVAFVNNCQIIHTLPEIDMGFVDPLKDISVPEKKQAKFECTITKEVPKVMWFRGAEIVTPSPKYEIIHDGRKHILIINTCEFDDEAEYTIEVLDQKSTAQLLVEGKWHTESPRFMLLMSCLYVCVFILNKHSCLSAMT